MNYILDKILGCDIEVVFSTDLKYDEAISGYIAIVAQGMKVVKPLGDYEVWSTGEKYFFKQKGRMTLKGFININKIRIKNLVNKF